MSQLSSQLIDEHVAFVTHQGLAVSTIRSRRTALNRLMTYLHDHHHLELVKATPAALQGWQASLVCGADGRRGLVMHCRAFYRWAADLELAPARLISCLVSPRIPRRTPRPIPEADLAVALIGAPPRIRPWLLLACLAGLRCVEIATLRWENLDLLSEMATIRVVGKGGHERVIPVGDGLRAELQADLTIKRRGWVFAAYTMGDHVPDPKRHVRPDQVSHLGSRFLHATGSAYTVHSLRHRFATDFYRDSLDLLLLKEVLGHANIQQTTVYAKVESSAALSVVNRIAARRLEGVDA